MIKVNGAIVDLEAFGDGTLKCGEVDAGDKNWITWLYDRDDELFALWCIARDIKMRNPNAEMLLQMPYIPHARQDRRVSGRIFTLKYFSEMINAMGFSKVYVLDPHSDVSTALIDRTVEMKDDAMFLTMTCMQYDAIMFPDAGAAKKYHVADKDVIIGNKRRNSDGSINSYDIINFKEGIKSVAIRDDICSYGGTFAAAAMELRKRGVDHIALVVSHCENNIIKGSAINYMNEVITTDTICTVEHPKIKILKRYRQGDI